VWQIYDTPLTNQGVNCTNGYHAGTVAECAMRNISYHHNLAANSGMACVEIWYGARFSTGIYTRGCHWSHACSLEALACVLRMTFLSVVHSYRLPL
jgi:hypothetical protein